MKKEKKFSKRNSVVGGPLRNDHDQGLGMMAGVAITLKQLAVEGITETIIDIGQSYDKMVTKMD